jgi:uncharacterized membrane protein YfcA
MHKEPAVSYLYVALGAVAGVLAGLFGIGGGVIMVIGMVGVMKVPFLTATGTSLAAMLLPVGLFGALEYHRRGHIDIKAAVLLAIGLTVGAWIGARLAQSTPTATLQRGFAVFLLFVAVRTWMTAR